MMDLDSESGLPDPPSPEQTSYQAKRNEQLEKIKTFAMIGQDALKM